MAALKPPAMTAARLLALLASGGKSRELSLAEAKRRFGITPLQVARVQRRLLSVHQDLGVERLNLSLLLARDSQKRLVIKSSGPELLSRVARLHKADAALASQALQRLALTPGQHKALDALAQRLRAASEGVEPAQGLVNYGGRLAEPLRAKVELLLAAMEQAKPLSFVYRGGSACRMVWPLSVREDKGVWRVLAWDPAPGKGLRCFVAQNMAQLRADEAAFPWPSQLGSVEQLRARDLSVYQAEAKDQRVTLKIKGPRSHVATAWLSPAQLKAALAGKAQSFSMQSGQPRWVARLAVQAWPDCQVLGPPAFKKAWESELEVMRRNNS
jgi:predicted DNA-binding transcriptional regulator YafY